MQRRGLLKAIAAGSALGFLPFVKSAASSPVAASKFIYCLNMATIRGHKLGFIKELETASRAGFTAVEIWVESLQEYLKTGGSLTEAKKRIDGLGLTVANAIGFAPWILDDESKRAAALQQMKQEMDMLAAIGCRRTAAPPAGATGGSLLDLDKVAERYQKALELGDKTGVVPHLELWGFSKNLSRLSQVMYVALQSKHPSAKVLLDIFHLYKGESGIDTLPLISKHSTDILHMNDYSGTVPPATITDADRIYPGDGVAPIAKVLKALAGTERPLILSCEVFNKAYYAQDALLVAKTAISRMKAVVAKSGA
jgi:2-keto-myo-inositol isomerase